MSISKQEGILVYNFESDRYDIRFSLTDYYGGLHCGECVDILIGNQWKPTRIEMDNEWYFVGINRDIKLQGLKVRI